MDKAKVRETLLTIVIGLLVLYFIFRLEWLLYIALGTGVSGLVSSFLGNLVHRAWYGLADALGFIMSKLILGLIFFFVLVPLGLLAGIFRKDFMFLRKRSDSYYVQRNHLFTPGDFNDPW